MRRNEDFQDESEGEGERQCLWVENRWNSLAITKTNIFLEPFLI